MVDNIVERGENAGFQHFSFSHNAFIRVILRVVKK